MYIMHLILFVHASVCGTGTLEISIPIILLYLRHWLKVAHLDSLATAFSFWKNIINNYNFTQGMTENVLNSNTYEAISVYVLCISLA